MYTDRPFCLICKGVAGMQMLVLSSYVVDNAKANVGFNRKFLKLATSCCEKTVFVTSNYPEELLEGLPGLTVENLPYRWDSSQKKNLPRYFRMQCRAIGHIRRHHTKGMPVVFWLSGPMILPFLFCKLTGKKTVVFLYGNTRYKQDKPSLYASLISRIMRFMARHADKIGVETPSVLAQWSLPERCAGKVFDLHLYVDDSGADTVPYEQRGPVVGMACRLQGNKHPLEAIEAFHRLRGAFPDWTLEIAGDGPEYERCRERVAALGEEDRIRMHGWVDNREMASYYGRWRLLLFPSNYEGLPNSVIESLRCGTPVLASPVGGIPDVIEEGETGWFLPGTTVEAMEAALSGLLKRDDLGDAGGRAEAFARKAFSFEDVLERFRTVFDVDKPAG